MILKMYDQRDGEEGWLFLGGVKAVKVEEGWSITEWNEGAHAFPLRNDEGGERLDTIMLASPESFNKFPAKAKLLVAELIDGSWRTYTILKLADAYLLSDEGKTVERL